MTDTLTTAMPSPDLHPWLLSHFALSPQLKARPSHSHVKAGNSLCGSLESPVTWERKANMGKEMGLRRQKMWGDYVTASPGSHRLTSHKR